MSCKARAPQFARVVSMRGTELKDGSELVGISMLFRSQGALIDGVTVYRVINALQSSGKINGKAHRVLIGGRGHGGGIRVSPNVLPLFREEFLRRFSWTGNKEQDSWFNLLFTRVFRGY